MNAPHFSRTDHLMRWFLLYFILHTSVWAETGFGNGSHYNFQELQITLTHYEVARSQPVVFVHFQVKNPEREDKTCTWKDLITLIAADGSRISSNYDALVDLGNGPTRTTGPFTVRGRQRVKISVPFLVRAEDFPARLELPDGRQSAPFAPRRTHR